MTDLFSYPLTAGYQARDTSKQAAVAVEPRAVTLRLKVKELFAKGLKLTADECAAELGETVLSIRPRLTELGKQSVIKDSGLRRSNESGRGAIVWVSV